MVAQSFSDEKYNFSVKTPKTPQKVIVWFDSKIETKYWLKSEIKPVQKVWKKHSFESA
jgi:hypothetical protein